MGNRKYIRAKQVHTITDFELSGCSWFEVVHGANFRMWHRSALENLQYHTLKSWIAQGIVFKTKEVKQEPFLIADEFLGMTKEDVADYIEKLGLDKNGLDEKDRKVLEVSVKMLKQKENKNGNQYK